MPPVPATPIGMPVVAVAGRPPIVARCVISRSVEMPRIISRPVIDGATHADGNVDASGLRLVGCQKSSRENCSDTDRALYDSTTGHRDSQIPRICIRRAWRARNAAGSEGRDCLETGSGRLDRCAEASRPNEASKDIRRALTSRQTTSANQGAIDKAQFGETSNRKMMNRVSQ